MEPQLPNAAESQPKLAAEVAASSHVPKWRNWGDHPFIVAVTLIGTILTTIATGWGLSKLIQETNQSAVTIASREIVSKTPAELVRWFNSGANELEARRQAKILYVGKSISVSGVPDIFAVHATFVQFRLANVYASIETRQLERRGLVTLRSFAFICRIEEIGKEAIMLRKCEIDE